MANLLDLLNSQMDDNFLDNLSSRIGGADRQQTATAASGILSTLVGALAKNASTPDGAANLANALERDHDGSVLDNLFGMLGGEAQPQNPRALNGAGILSHLLGERQGGAVDMISKMSGLDSSQTGNLMTMLAPMVMGMLGKQKQQQGLDIPGLTGMLTHTVASEKQSDNPLMNMATRFLDKDGERQFPRRRGPAWWGKEPFGQPCSGRP